MQFKIKMSPEEISKRIAHAMDLPFHHFLGLTIVKSDPGLAEIELCPTPKTINAGNVVHGGIIYSVLDIAAYLAMLPLLGANQNGVTHDIHVSVLRAAPIDKPLLFCARVQKIGKRIVFCDSGAWCEDQLIAKGQITKSIIEFP